MAGDTEPTFLYPLLIPILVLGFDYLSLARSGRVEGVEVPILFSF